MAHSRLNKNAMFDWIERCLNAGEPLPTDAAIVDRFVFHSTEQARTLLADLADAGRITIKGYGNSRTISLGRSKPGAQPAPRITPSVRREDRELDAGVAKITSILSRHKPPPASVKAQVTSKPTPIAAPTPPREEPVGTSKSITIVATGPLVDEIKRRTSDGTPNNRAVLAMLEELMERPKTVVPTPPAPPVVEVTPREPTIASIVGDLHAVFDALADRADRPDLSAELAAMTSRAETAELLLERASAALERVKAALP